MGEGEGEGDITAWRRRSACAAAVAERRAAARRQWRKNEWRSVGGRARVLFGPVEGSEEVSNRRAMEGLIALPLCRFAALPLCRFGAFTTRTSLGRLGASYAPATAPCSSPVARTHGDGGGSEAAWHRARAWQWLARLLVPLLRRLWSRRVGVARQAPRALLLLLLVLMWQLWAPRWCDRVVLCIGFLCERY